MSVTKDAIIPQTFHKLNFQKNFRLLSNQSVGHRWYSILYVATVCWFLPYSLVLSCSYGSPSSPSMVRTRMYSSASPTTDAAITAAITRDVASVNRYWLPMYEQANVATTVTTKLNIVTTTALTDRTSRPNSASVPLRLISWVLTLRVILSYSSLANLALIFSRRVTSSGFLGGFITSGRCSELSSSNSCR